MATTANQNSVIFSGSHLTNKYFGFFKNFVKKMPSFYVSHGSQTKTSALTTVGSQRGVQGARAPPLVP